MPSNKKSRLNASIFIDNEAGESDEGEYEEEEQEEQEQEDDFVVPTRSVRSQLEECRDIDWPEDVFTCAEKEAAEANRIAAHYQSCQATSTDYSKHDVDKDRSWWAHIAQRMQENVHIWRLAVQPGREFHIIISFTMKQNDLDRGKTHLGKPEVRGEQLDRGNGRVDTWRERLSKTKKERGKEKLGVACSEPFKVYSVFSVASVSGWIYVEAPTSRDVQRGLGDIDGVRGRIEPISIRDAGALLDLRTGSLVLTENSWVRIRRGLYRGDLAYVRCVREERVDKDDGDGYDEDIEYRRIATVKLIPRIPLSPLNEGTSKRKRLVNRPHPHFFDNHVISRAYGIQLTSETRQGPNGEDQLLWRFQKGTYCDGLLELDIALNMLNMDPAIAPNQDELSRWSSCPDLDIRKHASSRLKSTIVGSGFWPGDRVQVLGTIEDALLFEVEHKEIIDLRWTVLVIMENEAVLQLDQEVVSDVSETETPADALRQRFCDSIRVSLKGLWKKFRTGDFVRVMSGRDDGRYGWVVAWDADKDIVFLSEQGTHTHFEAWFGQVNIQEPERQWASLPPPLAQKDLHDGSYLNRQRLWHGMPVVVTAGSHKGKEGFIRSVTEHFDRLDLNSTSTIEAREHRCFKNCKSCILGYSFGHACSNWCLNSCSRRALVCGILSGFSESYLSKINVEVALSAAFGRVHTFEVKEIRVHDDILPLFAWLRACWTKNHAGLPRIPLLTEVEWDSATENKKREVPLTQVQQRWQKATMKLIACHQFFESRRFQYECEAVADDLKHRDNLIRAKNIFGLNPPWYTDLSLNNHERPLLGNAESRTWAPVYPSAPSLSLSRPQTPPPIQDHQDPDPTWNLQDSDLYSVADNWLGEDLRRLSKDPDIRIQLVIAGGKRASIYTRYKEGAKGYLLPSSDSSVDYVDVRLNDVVTVFIAINIRHVLPEHPSMVQDDVVVIAGPLKGQIRKVFKIDGGIFSIGVAGNKNRGDDTTHSGRELALVKIMPSKKRKKGGRK